MTPFGAKLRALRAERGITLKEMAKKIGVSNAYLSALEHGKRGRPSFELIQSLCGEFHIIWDEAEELKRLADISHPRIVIDTAGLGPEATELANRLAKEIRQISPKTIAAILAIIKLNE